MKLQGEAVNYEEFRIRLCQDHEAGYYYRAESTKGEISEELPRLSEFLASEFEQTGGIVGPLEKFSQKLSDILFTTRLARLFDSSRSAACQRGHGVRVCVQFDLARRECAVLFRLPWELLSLDGTYFALEPQTPIVRCIDALHNDFEAPPTERLRVIMALSSPEGTNSLDVEGEAQKAAEKLARNPSVRLCTIPRATADAIRDELLAEPCDVFHFAGHSEITDEGRAVLHSPTAASDYVGAECFGSLFRGQRLPKLVVLNSCNSAWGASRPDSALAVAMLREGANAVLAMGAPIRDDWAIRLSERLYAALAAGDSVEFAVTEARLGLYRQGSSRDCWPIPILFQRRQPMLPQPAPAPDQPADQGAVNKPQLSGSQGDQINIVREASGKMVNIKEAPNSVFKF